VKKKITHLLSLGSAIAAALVAAVPIPDDMKLWPVLVAAASYACVLGIVNKVVTPENLGRAAWILAGFLVLGLIFGFWCFALGSTRTISDRGHVYVKGELQDRAWEFIRKKNITEKEYFLMAGKNADDVWTDASIAKNRQVLALSYLGFTFLLTVGITGMLELTSKSEWPWLWIIGAAGVAASLLATVFAWLWITKP
jgi:hypothetical protein